MYGEVSRFVKSSSLGELASPQAMTERVYAPSVLSPSAGRAAVCSAGTSAAARGTPLLKITKKIDRILGAGTIYMLQKFFGIILLAISVKLFTHNLAILLKEMN